MWELTRIIVLGIGATLATDAWGFVARRLLGMQTLDYRLVGRWIESFPRGRFFHRNILEAQPTPNEKWLGWTAHFAIGIAFAWLFVALVDRDWLADPRPEVALVFGLASVALFGLPETRGTELS